MYNVYKAAGWHGDPTDPVILETDDEHEAAMRAGCRADIGMPGSCNPYDSYATDAETGDLVEPIESFCCDSCGEIVEWGEYGPNGAIDGRLLECPQAAEKHLVCWICDSCADDCADDADDDD
jgi:hypothetical protein